MIKTLKQTVQKQVITEITDPNAGETTILTCSFENAENAQTVGIYLNEGQCKVEWGDGTSDSIIVGGDLAQRVTHRYDDDFIEDHKNKTFNITVNGDIDRFHDPSYPYIGGIKTLIVSVSPLCKRQTSAQDLFNECVNLKTIQSDIFNYCAITNFARCFKNSGLQSVPRDLFKTALIDSNFSYIFANCDNLQTSKLEFNGPNSQQLEHFDNMFRNCKSLTSINENMFKHVSDKADLSLCFAECKKLKLPNTLLDSVPNANVSSIFGDILTPSKVKLVPRDLFSTFNESRLDSISFMPFLIEDYTMAHRVISAAKKNNIKIQVGSKEVGLEKLVYR